MIEKNEIMQVKELIQEFSSETAQNLNKHYSKETCWNTFHNVYSQMWDNIIKKSQYWHGSCKLEG